MSNLLDELTREDLQRIAQKVKDKIKAKEQDGEFCLKCKEFYPMAAKNFPQGLLCWSCNTHVNRVILNLQPDQDPT